MGFSTHGPFTLERSGEKRYDCIGSRNFFPTPKTFSELSGKYPVEKSKYLLSGQFLSGYNSTKGTEQTRYTG